VKRNTDPKVRAVLARLLGEISSFDTDLLDLLDGVRGEDGHGLRAAALPWR